MLMLKHNFISTMRTVNCIICLVLFYVRVSKSALSNNTRIIVRCEPENIKIPLQEWEQMYNFERTSHGFSVKLIHSSTMTFPNANLGFPEREFSLDEVPSYYQVLNLKKAGSLGNFRKSTYTFGYHFVAGDSMTVHQFDLHTGEYRSYELGYHTKKYFHLAHKGIIRVTVFSDHGRERYGLVGVTLFRGTAERFEERFYSREEMKQLFPRHSNAIDDIFIS